MMGKPHGSVRRPCGVCGIFTRRPLCAAHDPAKEARKASNASRRDAYRKRIEK